MKIKIIKEIILLAIFSCISASAQERKEQSEMSQSTDINTPFAIERIKGQVTLDGMSDEPAWEGIKPLQLKQRNPHFGEEPSEKTIVLIGYDNDNLYVAGRIYDREPWKIQKVSMQRDGSSYHT